MLPICGGEPASAWARRRRFWCTSSAMLTRCEKYEKARTTSSAWAIGRPLSSASRSCFTAGPSAVPARRKRTAVCRISSTRAKPAAPVCARSTSPSNRPSRRVSSLSGRSLSMAGVHGKSRFDCSEFAMRPQSIMLRAPTWYTCVARPRHIYHFPDEQRPVDAFLLAGSLRAPSGAGGQVAGVAVRRRWRALHAAVACLGILACGFFQATGHAGDDRAARRACARAQPAGLDRCALGRRKGQPLGSAPCPTYGPAPAKRCAAARRRRRHRAGDTRHAYAHARAGAADSRRRAHRRDGSSAASRRQPRHRRV